MEENMNNRVENSVTVEPETQNEERKKQEAPKQTPSTTIIAIIAVAAIVIVAILAFALGGKNGGSTADNGSNNGTSITNENTEKETEKDTEKETEKKPEVNNIFLSKSELVLGIGETANLIATVSPGNVETTLTWSSSNSDIAEVDNQGIVTAKGTGDAVIKVEAPNGVLAVCNVTVKIKTGKVTGTVTYKYNNYVGNKADTGALVILVSKSVTTLPDSLGLGLTSGLPEGCYGKKVDGSGNYTFDNVPTGEYYLIIMSKNTNENMDRVSGYGSWGGAYYLFSDKGKENALLNAKLNKTRTTSITVSDGQTTTYSYDFGITYI